MAKEGNNYIDKAEFNELMIERKKIVDAWKAKYPDWKDNPPEDDPKPKINDTIGKNILDIATNLAFRHNFINYTYRDEMIGDAIETCIRYADNFDPEKSNNPFAYFTQICYYSFVRRINKEAKQQDIKKKWIEKLGVEMETYSSQMQDDDKSFTNTSADFAQKHLT